MENKKFKGIYPALITPFSDMDTIDVSTLRLVIERCLNQGVDGFYVGGSTGESLLLTDEERMELLELTMKYVNGRAKVIAQVGCIGTARSLALAKHAQSVNVDAISSIPPIYFNFNENEIAEYYKTLADSVSVPLFLYHVPALSGVKMDDDIFNRLLEHPNIEGVKFTAYDSYQLQRLIVRFPNKTFINGHDELYINNAVIGCDCAIGSTFNIMADQFVQMQHLCEIGDYECAAKIQDRVNSVLEVMIRFGVFQSIKESLRLMGIGNGKCRKPFKPLSSEQSATLKEALNQAGVLS